MTASQIKSPRLVALACSVLVSWGTFSAITTTFQVAGSREACVTRLADDRWGAQGRLAAATAATVAPAAEAKVAESGVKLPSAKL